jgi:hypothetical protein
VDLRVLDLVESDQYRYTETPESEGVDTFSMAGKFVTVMYSVRNTSTNSQTVDLSAKLRAGAETFQEDDGVEYPRLYEIKLEPREVTTAEFIFDVPTDVTPETLEVSGVGNVDLTRGNLEAIPPEERLATQYEYANHEDYKNAYALFDESSRAKFTEEQYTAYWAEGPDSSIYTYAFPSVEVSGSTAKVTGVYSAWVPKDYEKLAYRNEYEMVMENGAWHMVARDEQVEAFSGGGQTTTASGSSSASASAP